MIIYGTRNKQVAKEIITDKCQNCGTQNCIDMHVFQGYAHVFWIPFFPTGKRGVSQCDHCKQVLELKDMPKNLRESYNNLKAQTKAPIWMYLGLACLAILIALSVLSDKQKDEKNAKLILTPQIGDIFEIKTKENQYTLYKVAIVEGDSIFIRPSNYETNKVTGIESLKGKDYSNDVYGLSRRELKAMLKNGEIIDIDRKLP